MMVPHTNSKSSQCSESANHNISVSTAGQFVQSLMPALEELEAAYVEA